MEKEEKELIGHVMISARRDAKIKRELELRKGNFINEKLDEERSKLGNKEFDKRRDKLTREFEQRWEQLQKAKATLRILEEQMSGEIMDFAPLEKAYRLQLEAEGCANQVIEKTLLARRRDFETAQNRVKARLRPKIDPDADFRQRILNPATRREAIEKYLIHHTQKTHFLTEVFNMIFEALDERKRR